MKHSVAAAVFLANLGVTNAFGEDCKIENHCLIDQDIRAEIVQSRVRDKSATVAIRLTNTSDKPVKASIYGLFLQAIGESGATARLEAGNTKKFELRPNSVRSLGYSVEFKESVGSSFDLTFTLENPAASYSFFGLK